MSTTTGKEVAEGYIRLHVTPFRPELLNIYLGPSLAPLARNISYHTIETFPEKGFGYLELPTMEATKLKKKLNGSILKGQKIRLEDAKPEKRKRESGDETAVNEEDERKEKKKSKKVKAQEGVLPGYELEDGRKVKRGWTETPEEKRKEKDSKKDKRKDKSEKKDKKDKKDKKVREASKYTGEPECLFRTTLPPNVESQQSEEKKSKKDKKKGKREVVVHEFSNSKKHSSFLKSSKVDTNGNITQEYIDGKGWVDAKGNVLEEETEKQREKRERKERKKAEKRVALDEESSEQDEEPESAMAMDIAVDELHDPHDTSAPENATQTSPTAEIQASEQPKEIHPLEALYKRPKLPTLDISPNPTPKESTFSFFGGENDSDIDEDMPDTKQGEDELQNAVTDMMPPQTPFTKQDMEWRGTRSAAPTPDTAAIGRRFSFSFMGHIPEDDEDDEDEDEDGDVTPGGTNGVITSAMEGLGIANGDTAAGQGKEQDGEVRNESEFAKWFYDHRSENNKKWRARRKEAMKLKRKRENRRLTRRIV